MWLTAPGSTRFDVDQMQAWNSLEVSPISCEEREIVKQSNSGNQAIRHADRPARAIEVAPNLGGSLGRREIEGQDVQRVDELPEIVTALSFFRAAEQFETRYGRSPEPVCANVLRYLF